MLRNKFIKTLLQSQELCLYSSHKSPVYIQPGEGEEKVSDDELHRTGLFIAELENARFTEELVLIHTFGIMKEVLISFFFHQQLITAPSTEKTNYNSQLHLPRSYNMALCENAHVIYDSGISP